VRSSRGVIVALITAATCIDVVAYSVAVPVLPDLSRRLGASPTTIGLLFASFGATLLSVSIPMGVISDRIGRKTPLVAGLFALGAATCLFAFAPSLRWLFAARLGQGAADAVTWVVGFALIADLYQPSERGRIVGFVMAGNTTGFILGPSIGGWLYERGGPRVPFVAVGMAAFLVAAAFVWVRIPRERASREPVPLLRLIALPAVAACAAAIVAGAATISMLEPVLPLFLSARLGVGPARIGLLFGFGAVISSIAHPVLGAIADRLGSRRLTLLGLLLVAGVLPLLSHAPSYPVALALFAIQAIAVACVITPSLAYMAEAVSQAGVASFGIAYGVYNVAWGAGLLGGPALGGFLFERIGFAALSFVWSPALVAVTILLARVPPSPRSASTLRH
jgi:DHA1 family solute carrier family 18 vesicular amine transporter 1/2